LDDSGISCSLEGRSAWSLSGRMSTLAN
jgi:hypothetical protein